MLFFFLVSFVYLTVQSNNILNKQTNKNKTSSFDIAPLCTPILHNYNVYMTTEISKQTEILLFDSYGHHLSLLAKTLFLPV